MNAHVELPLPTPRRQPRIGPHETVINRCRTCVITAGPLSPKGWRTIKLYLLVPSARKVFWLAYNEREERFSQCNDIAVLRERYGDFYDYVACNVWLWNEIAVKGRTPLEVALANA